MVTTPDYSFVEFSDNPEDCQCTHLLEIAKASELCFPVTITANKASLYLTNISGDKITKIKNYIGPLDQFVEWVNITIDLDEFIACGDCFRLLIEADDKMYYSNSIMYDKESKHALVEFWSRINTFFPFQEDQLYSLRLPIEIVGKNPETETEEYVDANGYIHNTFKMRRNVYEFNVNYVPVSFHKKIQIVLMHDVYINEIKVNETGDYQINYDETLQENGVNLHKASSEVSEQDILLMRNY